MFVVRRLADVDATCYRHDWWLGYHVTFVLTRSPGVSGVSLTDRRHNLSMHRCSWEWRQKSRERINKLPLSTSSYAVFRGANVQNFNLTTSFSLVFLTDDYIVFKFQHHVTYALTWKPSDELKHWMKKANQHLKQKPIKNCCEIRSPLGRACVGVTLHEIIKKEEIRPVLYIIQ